ncbi:MAG: polysaccharide pyruvyl transferase family protein [Saccharospirillum sp.]|uniref:polysaccharide pyruvyl transferase family protein n=1 Tax=Saccharospirillum sp. TaxID=2033801 RepID=UPI0032989E73
MSTEYSTTKKIGLRIGIVSLYGWLKLWDNYGTLLQNFALQKFLQQRGHTTFWIRTRPTPQDQSKWKQLYSKILSNLRSVIRFLLTPILGISGSKRLSNFNKRNPRYFSEFMTRHVSTTPQEFTLAELVDKPPMVDALIVGSDQVWREVTKLNFLGFGPRQIRRIAYAVSAPWPVLDNNWFQSAIQFTSKLDAVSVREAEGLSVCDKLNIKDAIHVIDPVLLLKAEQYLDVVQQDSEDRTFSNPFMLGYFVNINTIHKIPWQPTVDFAKTNKYDLRVVPMQGAELVIPKENIFTPSPSAWLNAFHKAECVVTNSYHGALFAIVMRKPFLVFLQDGVKSHENCRFTSALEPLGLSDRILAYDTWNAITPEDLSNRMSGSIDWKTVEIALNKWRDISSKFLDTGLQP